MHGGIPCVYTGSNFSIDNCKSCQVTYILNEVWVCSIVHNIECKRDIACEIRTVEPPNKGHFGNGHFVLFSEAVPISEACHCLTI